MPRTKGPLPAFQPQQAFQPPPTLTQIKEFTSSNENTCADPVLDTSAIVNREQKLFELVDIMDANIEQKDMRIFNLETELHHGRKYLAEVEEENNAFYDQLQLYKNSDAQSTTKISDIVAKIGNKLTDDYKKTHDAAYVKMFDDMRQARRLRRGLRAGNGTVTGL